MDKEKITTDYLRRKFEAGYEVIMAEFDPLCPDGGKEWILDSDDTARLIVYLYECSDKVRESIDKSLESGLTDPMELWFNNNEDLIVEEAWANDWMGFFSD